MIDYVVVWNGVNDGRGGDLLSDGLKESRVEPKAAPVSSRRLKGELLDQVMAVLQIASRWLTMRELSEVAGIPMASMNQSLYVRVRDGRIARTQYPIALSSHGNPECGYALPGKFLDDSAPTTKRARHTFRGRQRNVVLGVG